MDRLPDIITDEEIWLYNVSEDRRLRRMGIDPDSGTTEIFMRLTDMVRELDAKREDGGRPPSVARGSVADDVKGLRFAPGLTAKPLTSSAGIESSD